MRSIGSRRQTHLLSRENGWLTSCVINTIQECYLKKNTGDVINPNCHRHEISDLCKQQQVSKIHWKRLHHNRSSARHAKSELVQQTQRLAWLRRKQRRKGSLRKRKTEIYRKTSSSLSPSLDPYKFMLNYFSRATFCIYRPTESWLHITPPGI